MTLPSPSPNFPVSINSPVQIKHLVASPPDLLLPRLMNEYATQEQLLLHSTAHSCNELMFPPAIVNLSGAFISVKAKKTSPHPCNASFRRHPAENLPATHSFVLAGSKPLRHLHTGMGATVSSQ